MDVPPAELNGGVVRGSETQTPVRSAQKMARVLKASASAHPTPGAGATPTSQDAQQDAAPSAA